MRVSDQMVAASIASRLSIASERLFRLQEQAGSGLAFQRPSQDPAAALRAAALRSNVAEAECYRRNAEEAAGQLKLAEAGLTAISRHLQEARSAALGATDVSQAGNLALADQVHQIALQITREMNQTTGGRYLFAGYQVLTPPVVANPAGVPPYLYQGDYGEAQVQLGRGLTVTVNLTAAHILNLDQVADPGAEDVLEALRCLEKALRSDDREGVTEALRSLERHAHRVLGLRGELGARVRHVEQIRSRLDEAKAAFQALLSQAQDADLTEVVIALRSQEITYQAATVAAAALHRASLLDYLR